MDKKLIVGVEDLAEYFGKTARTVQLWVDELGMPKIARGRYDLLECAKWRMQHLESELEVASNSGDETHHQLKMEGQKIMNQERSLKVKRMVGELVDREAVRIAWTNECNNFKKAVKSCENRLAYALQKYLTDAEAKVIIERELGDMLNILSELTIEEAEYEDDEVNDN